MLMTKGVVHLKDRFYGRHTNVQKEHFFLDLQLFADGADGGAGATGESPSGAADAGQQQNVPTTRRRANPNANTVYGQPQPGRAQAGQQGQQGQQKLSFDDLLKTDPDYKAAYDERVQKAINGRFKQAKALEDDREKLRPVLEILSTKYGLRTDDVANMDIDGLVKAIQDDDSYYEEEALEKGISVDSLKELKKMEAENTRLKKLMQQAKVDEQNMQKVQNLQLQAVQLKEIYPGFDLDTEMRNRSFADLVWNSGWNVKNAYEAVHHEEILSGAIRYSANRAQQMAAASVQANAQRPVENGMNGAPTALHVTDPTKLTREQRKDLKNRVYGGAKISW